MSIFEAFRRAMVGLLIAGALGIVIAGIFLGYSAYTLPLSPNAASEQAPAAMVFADTSGQPVSARGVFRGDKLSADQLPQNLVQAVVAIEDRRFFSHGGIDLRGIARAVWHNLTGHSIEGASTITQQLARITYLSPERSIRRKVQEAMLALWLESRLSKQEILARYLNSVYFGAGAYGADAAAKRYFGKKAADLTLAESVMLAGLVRAPSQLAPNRNPEAARRRADTVIQAMVDTGALDKPRADDLRAHPAKLAVSPEAEPGQNYFFDAAADEVKRLVGSPPLDLKVGTTLDVRLQQAAERIVEHWLTTAGANRQVGQAALIAMAPDGAIVAMIGGRDYRESQFNRAVQAHRQPGSLFKVIVYLTALNAGYTADSVVEDRPVQIGDWEPKNFENRYRGPVSLRTAFAHSINTVAAQLVQAVGVQRVIDTARSLGIQSELPPVPSLALGSAEVTLLEMTRVMGALAINSKSVEPYTIRSIAAQAAAPLYNRPETVRDPPPWNRAELVRLMEGVVTEGTGKAARLDRRTAGKTGTTQDYRDAWFVGFTTELVTGVWVGNDDNSPMDGVTGGDIPARIWHDFMVEAGHILATKPQAPTSPASETAAPTPAPSAPPAAPAAPQQAMAPPAPGTEAVERNDGPSEPAVPISGVPLVLDTATLVINGTVVRLSGVEGQSGPFAVELLRYIRGREVACMPTDPEAGDYRCRLGDRDLGEIVILSGAGRALDNAPREMVAAQTMAQRARRGIWR
jgi:1A family penicillin-binding protein